jgi:hypothetical protein
MGRTLIHTILTCLRCLSDSGKHCNECIDELFYWVHRRFARVCDFLLGLFLYGVMVLPFLALLYIILGLMF